ncbi:H-NS histone [Burkholderia sp. ABCPW 14]|uniref:H-NS histone family protein n=1 Tax=Burkholderia sp. ABCPW 14 TaxID=1637860 RepID=UPI000770C687|nr:H-NS histone family protein [Burkholderia sp. ABCPW 14]KVD78027.1 H-NS histone [Burkholderia sp. ABCPW 14]
MSKYEELKAQAVALEAEMKRLRQGERNAVLQEVRGKVREYELTAQEVFGQRRLGVTRRTSATVPVRPKYQDPVTGATWAGRGREPAWIRGRNRDEFLIDWA